MVLKWACVPNFDAFFFFPWKYHHWNGRGNNDRKEDVIHSTNTKKKISMLPKVIFCTVQESIGGS